MKERFFMFQEKFNSPESEDKSGKTDSVEDELSLFGGGSGTEAPHTKQPRRITLTTFICSSVALVLAAVMLTYTLCNSAYQQKIAEIRAENAAQSVTGYSELDILAQIFAAYSFEDLDEEEIRTQVLKAYVRATGDKYAEYYTNEEYAKLLSQMAGDSQGIGINIINSSVIFNGSEYKSFKVINVVKDSPAEEFGLKVGDHIIAVGTKSENTTLNALGYDKALAELQGEKETTAEFLYIRQGKETVDEASILRKEFTATSVISQKADDDVGRGIGVVKITNFDLTTPSQLIKAIEDLKEAGCSKFVFDVRHNPGGELSSIVAVLSLFLEEGDTIISVKDKNGNGETTVVAPVEYLEGKGCSVMAEDIGRYKDLDMVVLCNENTASAAELFVANFRDHSLGEIVGTKTYGKGSMQTYINLALFGIDGVLKITNKMYYPPNGESYDGVGIEPTYVVEISEEAAKENTYDIMGTAKDNQLVAAVNKYFK